MSLFQYMFIFFSLVSCTSHNSSIPIRGIFHPWDRALCLIREPVASKEIYDLPIDAREGVYVSQGPLNPGDHRSHGYANCMYAVDFAHYQEDSRFILASRAGRVIGIYEGCSHQNCNHGCGDGFGNWVALLHDEDEVSFYAHLEQISVHIGQALSKGERIGIEGNTGNAGARHLHFSLYRLNGADPFSVFPYLLQPIPYRLRYYGKGKQPRIVDIRIFRGIDTDKREYLYGKRE